MKKEQTAKQNVTRTLAECAILIALAVILSLIKLGKMPYGGSVTLASLLPIVLISYRHGPGWGLCCATVFGIVKQLLGLDNIFYLPSKTLGTVLIVVFFDYLIAFGVIGLAGVFRKIVKKQTPALIAGCFATCLLRLVCHVISGVTVWSSYAPENLGVFNYALIYNAMFMVPETIVLCLAALYIGQALDLSKPIPERAKKSEPVQTFTLRLVALGLIVAAVIYNVITLFSAMRDGEGSFSFAALGGKDVFFWLTVFVINAIVIIVSVFLLVLSHKTAHSSEKAER